MMQKCTSLGSLEKTSSKSTSNSEGGFLGHCASVLFLLHHKIVQQQPLSDVLMQLPADTRTRSL